MRLIRLTVFSGGSLTMYATGVAATIQGIDFTDVFADEGHSFRVNESAEEVWQKVKEAMAKEVT